MNDLIIRQADDNDIGAIVWIEKVCFSTPWSSNAIHEEVKTNDMAFHVVAEVDDKVVGYMGVWLILDEGHITNVAVLPNYRNCNIASAMIRAVIDYTEKNGVRKHTLEVRRSNQAARKLYQKFNFKEAGRRKGYYKDNNEDAIVMWRDPDLSPRN